MANCTCEEGGEIHFNGLSLAKGHVIARGAPSSAKLQLQMKECSSMPPNEHTWPHELRTLADS